MNNSLRSVSPLRQSARTAGSADDSSAFLRRCTSRCVRAAMRARDALAIFSSACFAAGFLPVWGLREPRLKLLADHVGHDPGRGRSAQHLLRLTLELRLRHRTVTTAVSPS